MEGNRIIEMVREQGDRTIEAMRYIYPRTTGVWPNKSKRYDKPKRLGRGRSCASLGKIVRQHT